MKDYILTFRNVVHRAKDILDESEFVNNFMWEHSLYGKDIYDELLHEVQQIKDFEESMREVAVKHDFSITITPRSSCINRGEANFCGTAFV